jgi:hypothetical protein
MEKKKEKRIIKKGKKGKNKIPDNKRIDTKKRKSDFATCQKCQAARIHQYLPLVHILAILQWHPPTWHKGVRISLCYHWVLRD